ncbi:MAG: sulfatase, partial [Planctomycetota bacterium]
MKKHDIENQLTRRDVVKWGLCGMAGGSLASSLFISGCSKSQPKPHIFLVVVDTLRPDHLGCYNYPRQTSPNLDAFAAENLLFQRCFSHAPVTGPSCSSFLTGFLPHETTILNNSTRLPEVPTISKLMKKGGYKTYGVVSNYVLRKKMGFGQGFDIYDDQMDVKEINRSVAERVAEKTTDKAIEILDAHTEGPLFMWIHYQDPHGPYTPPKPYDTLFVNPDQKPLPLTIADKGGIPKYQKLADHTDYHYYIAQYDGEVRYYDDQFGRLLTWLKGNGMYDNSMIVFTSDHGEAMGEYNYFFAHGHNLSNNQIHVPLIVKEVDGRGGTRPDNVQHLDIVPTLLMAAGVPRELPYRGRDLRTHYSTPASICSELNVAGASLVVGQFKLLLYGQSVILFDLVRDPQEKRNLASDPAHKARINQMAKQLIQLYKREDLLRVEIPTKKDMLTEEEKR